MNIRAYLGMASLCLVVVAGCKKKEAQKSTTAADPQQPAAAVVEKPAETKKELPATPTAATLASPKQVSSAAIQYLPKQCEIAIHVNIASILATPAVKQHIVPALEDAKKQGEKKNKEFQVFLKASGMDPVKDFKEAAFCLKDIKNSGSPTVSFVATGNLKAGLIDALAKTSKKKLKPVEIAGAKGYKGDGISIVQTTKGVLVGGNQDGLVKEALAVPNGFKGEFSKLGTDGFGVVVPESVIKKAFSIDGNPFVAYAKKIAGASTMALNLAAGVFEVRISTTDDKAAIELAGVAKLVLANVPKAKLQGPQAMAFAMLSGAEIGNDGSNLSIKVKLPQQQIAALAQAAAVNIRQNFK